MKNIVYASSLVLISMNVQAGAITADFAFEKRPPFVGLIYINDGGETVSQDVDQKQKQFMQKVFVNKKSAEVIFKNSDGISHNIFANSVKEGVKFDVGLLPPGLESKVPTSNWADGAVVRVGCKIHPKMKTYVASISSSQQHIIEFEKKIKSYQVTFENVEGEQPITLWMPGYKRIHIALKPGETKEIILLKKKKIKGKLTLSFQ